jgi:hypothetical protein
MIAGRKTETEKRGYFRQGISPGSGKEKAVNALSWR